MAENHIGGRGAVARVFTHQPNRVTAAWRRVRFSLVPQGHPPDNLLDNVVESFVREMGGTLSGATGSPWSRTRGVLRISPLRGTHAFYDEFSALRRCLLDAVEALGGGATERAIVSSAVDEAVDSAVASFRKLADPDAPDPEVVFGGLVVEYFEDATAAQRRLPRLSAVPFH